MDSARPLGRALAIGLACLLIPALSLELFAAAAIELLFHKKLSSLRPSYLMQDIYDGKVDAHEWGVWGRPRYRGVITRSCFEIHYAFNAVGARDKDRGLRGAPGVARTVMLGDSFIEGYGVEPDRRVSDILERRTGQEYLNFGSAFDFGPLQYWLLYEHLARRYDHDRVIVGFFPANDFTDNDPESPQWKQSRRFRPYWRLDEERRDFTVVYKGLENRDRGYPLAFHALTLDRKLSYLASCSYFLNLVKRVFMSIRFRVGTSYNGYLERDADRLRATELIFTRLAASIGPEREKILLVIPTYEEVIALKRSHGTGSPGFNDLLARLARAGYRVINLLDYQTALGDKDNDALYLRPCDGHWSPAGNEYVATVVRQHLGR